jgi:phage gpG-like protein
MPAVKGSFAALRELREQLRDAASPAFQAELARVLGAAALKQVADGFKGSRDPYGKKWEPLRARAGKPLLDTGRMAASVAVTPGPSGFELHITANYASYHQLGVRAKPRTRSASGRFVKPEFRDKRGRITRRMRIPRRAMIPDDQGGGLGPIWTRALQRQADGFVRDHFRGRG